MDAILIGLVIAFFLFTVAAFIGLIKPSLVKQKTRGKAFSANIIPAIVALIAIGFVSPEGENTGTSPNQTKSNNPEEVSKPQNSTDSTSRSKAGEHINLVVDSLNQNYGIQAEYLVGQDYCANSNFCSAMADKVQIQTMGYIVDALPSSQVSPRYYQKVCAAILIALTDANQELAEQTIYQYFNFAAENQGAKGSLLNVDVTIRATSDNLLKCEFVKP